MTQAVVVGSGPNGLAAALVLADAGLEVTVFEANARLGGGARSAELTLPGLIHDTCSGLHPLALDTRFSRHFELDTFGLRWREAPVEYAHPLEDGRGAAAFRSVEVTADRIGGQDGRTWRRIFGPLTDRFDTIADEFLQPMLHVPRHPFHLARFGTYAAQPATLLGKRWKTPEARGLFAGVAAHAFRPLNTPVSSAIGTALATAAHRYGWVAAEGGSQAITDAMVRAGTELGVTYQTGVRVASVKELGNPDLVLLDTSPSAAADILGDGMPARVARAYRRFRHGPGAFKVDFAVQGGVPWAHEDSQQASTIHVGGTMEEIAAAERDVVQGRMPERPFVLAGQQYVADPSRSAGDVHPFYAYAHVPAGYEGDATEAIVSQIERYAPGFRDRILATAVTTTTGMSVKNPNYVGGDICTGANDMRQLVFRPRVALDLYSTGVPGAYLCSAATPPGAGAHGMCGWWAAQSALKSLRAREV